MKLYIGITKEDELIYIEWDKVDNEERKTFSLCGGTYGNPKTEEEGEEEARKVLRTREYWEDIGMLPFNTNNSNILIEFINFDDVAERVLNLDGWENVCGEFNHFGEFEGEETYLHSSSYGQHREERKDIKELWISEDEYKTIMKFWKKDHLKTLKKNHLDFFNLLFDKHKGLCSDQEVLIKYMECLRS